VEAQADCVKWGWSRRPATPGEPILTPRSVGPVCERGRSATEEAFERILNEARLIEQHAADEIAIVAPEGRVLARR